MSNHLALGTVTAALGEVAHAAAESAVDGVALRFGRPAAPAGGTTDRTLNVYLYQVTPNAALRNADLPARNATGQITQRPAAALDLHYLLSFYGDDQKLEPERMLGAVVRDLHSMPVLTAKRIQDAIGAHTELAASDLARSVEPVKVTLAPMSLEEMSRLWSVMAQTPHALSVPLVATVVLIEATETASPALPVLQRGEGDRGVDMLVGPFARLDSCWAGAAAAARRRPRPPGLPSAQLGATLVFAGANLGGETTAVRFTHPRLDAPTDVTVVESDRGSGELRLMLPDDDPAQDSWAAGIYGVVARVERGGAAKSSNTLPLLLSPRITGIEPASTLTRDSNGAVSLTVKCRPKVLPRQTAVLLLAGREVAAVPRATASETLNFTIEDAPVLTAALVRLRVDGVDSLPFKYDEGGTFVFDDTQRVSIA